MFISLAEDPKVILEQNIRDMRDKIPEMNTGIAKARGGILLLEHEIADYNSEIAHATARVKACLLGGDEASAGQFAVTLKQKQEACARSEAQRQQAQAGYDGLLKLKEKYMGEVKRRTQEAADAIKDSEAAKWKSELADTFQSFEVAGVDATHDEMIERLKQKNALAEGKIAAAVEGMDMKSIELEQKATEIEGQELLKQFKLDLGLTKVEPVNLTSTNAASAALDEFKKNVVTV
jgi:phage shock protein A